MEKASGRAANRENAPVDDFSQPFRLLLSEDTREDKTDRQLVFRIILRIDTHTTLNDRQILFGGVSPAYSVFLGVDLILKFY